MKRVVGIGGVFFEARDPEALYVCDIAILRTEDLDALLLLLAEEGVTIDPKREEYDYGKFAWIMDPEGNRIELWEPK